MPLYTHKDENTGRTVEILRSFSEHTDPPTTEEAMEGGLTEEEASVAVWRKILGTGIRLVKGATWGPGKGFW